MPWIQVEFLDINNDWDNFLFIAANRQKNNRRIGE
jgi:hypothetical protein